MIRTHIRIAHIASIRRPTGSPVDSRQCDWGIKWGNAYALYLSENTMQDQRGSNPERMHDAYVEAVRRSANTPRPSSLLKLSLCI